MKKRKYILSVLLNLLYFLSFSQGEFIVEIDRTSGSFVKTGLLISGITYVYPNFRAYDENNGIFIFPSSDNPTRLYSIDVTNDTIINNPVYSNLLVEFEYSNALNILYGVLKDNINNVKYFVSINPVTGLSTMIGASIPGSSTYQGFSTFDQINLRYIFLDPSNRIYSIDATNGNIVSNPNLALSANEQLLSISFDDSTSTLYGILKNNFTNLFYLVSINTSTGIVTHIGTGISLLGGSGSSAIDLLNQQFIYLYYNGSYGIATIDIFTGNVIHNNIISPLIGLDNVFSLKYDNIQGKTYSIHWEDITQPTSINNINQNFELAILPNPFSSQTTLQTDQIFKNATLIVYNSQGQRVKQINNISGQVFPLFRDNLVSGLYFLQLIQANQICTTEKLMITDN